MLKMDLFIANVQLLGSHTRNGEHIVRQVKTVNRDAIHLKQFKTLNLHGTCSYLIESTLASANATANRKHFHAWFKVDHCLHSFGRCQATSRDVAPAEDFLVSQGYNAITAQKWQKCALYDSLSEDFVHFILARVEKLLKLFRVQVVNRLDIFALFVELGHLLCFNGWSGPAWKLSWETLSLYWVKSRLFLIRRMILKMFSTYYALHIPPGSGSTWMGSINIARFIAQLTFEAGRQSKSWSLSSREFEIQLWRCRH